MVRSFENDSSHMFKLGNERFANGLNKPNSVHLKFTDVQFVHVHLLTSTPPAFVQFIQFVRSVRSFVRSARSVQMSGWWWLLGMGSRYE